MWISRSAFGKQYSNRGKHKRTGWIVKQNNIAGIILDIPDTAKTQQRNAAKRLVDARR